MSGFQLLAKIAISVIAIVMFVVPEPASTITGVVLLGAVWGIDLGDSVQ